MFNLTTDNQNSPVVVLAIGGFDPSSGAGVTADLKTIAAHHLYGVACVTALTVQSTQGVRRFETVGPRLVRETLEALVEDTKPAAVKVGMLGTGSVAAEVAEFLRTSPQPNVVLDPVLESSSGATLLDDSGVQVLRTDLLRLADMVTPNVPEGSKFTGIAVRDLESMKAACRSLIDSGARNVVVKGGHLPEPTDLLAERQGNGEIAFRVYPGKRLETGNTHGTGCAFSTALACNLAVGKSLGDAVLAAKNYVAGALGTAYSVGKAVGPVNHFFSD
ncbi:MAG: bifunctional hydroxymethylpyrimidine kinase/phosphomethylpyrimidine kinase [Terriglobales bacterium]